MPFTWTRFIDATFVRATRWSCAAITAWFDRWVWGGLVQIISALTLGFGYLDSFCDTHIVNTGF